MRYFSVTRGGKQRLVASDGDTAYDLSSAPGGPETVSDLLTSGDDDELDLDALAERFVDDAATVESMAGGLDAWDGEMATDTEASGEAPESPF